MVAHINKEQWQCPQCMEIYDNEIDAQECIERCTEFEEPRMIGQTREFMCEYCKIHYNSKRKAEKCEQVHEEKEDKHFEAYHEALSRERLKKASEHPAQITLLQIN